VLDLWWTFALIWVPLIVVPDNKHQHDIKATKTKHHNMHVSETYFNSLFHVMLMNV
jgi:hypothetical protein